MRICTMAWLAALSCSAATDSEVCEERLYGQPTASTGLIENQCGNQCGCEEDEWTPHRLSEATLGRMERLRLRNPPALLLGDPYQTTPELQPEPGVCATLLDSDARTYELRTFESAEDATSQGGFVTHTGACGQCSALQNLAVYARYPDLTDPVRDCGVETIFSGVEDNIACLMNLGFDEACAQIWAYNTTHTREVCLEPCLALLDAPHHNADGTLNACIQCDEDESGPVFKAISGRTRRNSGLPSALCRPCDSVSRVSHAHWEETL